MKEIKIGYIWLQVSDITFSLYTGDKRIIRTQQ